MTLQAIGLQRFTVKQPEETPAVDRLVMVAPSGSHGICYSLLLGEPEVRREAHEAPRGKHAANTSTPHLAGTDASSWLASHDRSFEFLPGDHALHQARWTFRGEDERGWPVDVAVTFNHEWIRYLLADQAR